MEIAEPISSNTGDPSSGINPSLVWSGKSFVALWSTSSGATDNVSANEYVTNLGTAVVLSDGDHSTRSPVLGADSRGNVFALWNQQPDTSGILDVEFARLVGATDKWSSPSLVEAVDARFEWPQIIVGADGTAVAAWLATTLPYGDNAVGAA